MNPAAPVTNISIDCLSPPGGLRPLRCPNRMFRAGFVSRSASPQEPPLRVFGSGGQLAYFVREAFDLLRQEVVLLEFPPKEVERDRYLLLDALRREEIDVRRLVLVVAEVADLHQALIHERAEAVVHPSDADAELAR